MNEITTNEMKASTPGAEETPVTPPPVTPASDSPDEAPGAPPLTRREALSHYERLIEESFDREKQRALALLAVHDQKLYKLTHPSFRAYVKQRWGLSVSRAYQLLHEARVRMGCRQHGNPPPANERQARELAADGTPVAKKADHDFYQRELQQATRSLAARLGKLPPGEQQRFIRDLRGALDQFEHELGFQSRPISQTVAERQNEPNDSAAATATGCSKPAPDGPPLTWPAAPTPTAEPAVAVNQPAPAELPVPSTPAEEPSSKAKAPTRDDDAQEYPAPPDNTIGVFGLTMDQARRLGYVR